MFEINEELLKRNYSDIKTFVDSLDISSFNNHEADLIIKLLKEDSRKNVQRLGLSLERQINKHQGEINRVTELYNFDRSYSGGLVLAGVDEVGRGPLAGPIVAAAVILPLSSLEDIILYINDSKSVSPSLRESLSEEIKSRAIAYAIAECSNHEIDEKGISFCNNKIFIDAVEALNPRAEIVLSDGYKIKNYQGRNEAVIKGDAKSASIACASIIAKVYRDNILKRYAEIYPQYDFASNVGYGSQKHIEAIKKFGLCEIHRRTFVRNIIS